MISWARRKTCARVEDFFPYKLGMKQVCTKPLTAGIHGRLEAPHLAGKRDRTGLHEGTPGSLQNYKHLKHTFKKLSSVKCRVSSASMSPNAMMLTIFSSVSRSTSRTFQQAGYKIVH